MSDHLIAEANRHAKALAVELNNLSVELNLLREWQREVIQNARAHHAERKDANVRADRAEAEAERYRLVSLRQDAELATEREKVQMLRNALQSLHDEQNGAPLRRRRDHWQMAMNNASSALAATEDTP
jgi:predicted  nucleic acid-binding Zn-ribbon protein